MQCQLSRFYSGSGCLSDEGEILPKRTHLCYTLKKFMVTWTKRVDEDDRNQNFFQKSLQHSSCIPQPRYVTMLQSWHSRLFSLVESEPDRLLYVGVRRSIQVTSELRRGPATDFFRKASLAWKSMMQELMAAKNVAQRICDRRQKFLGTSTVPEQITRDWRGCAEACKHSCKISRSWVANRFV